MNTRFENHLNELTENDWKSTVTTLNEGGKIHEVDSAATEVWFTFYPLALFRHLQKAEDEEVVLRKFVIQGNYSLRNQVDTSHRFFWGHRFWRDVKHAVIARAGSFEADKFDLNEEATLLARSVANGVKQEESLLIGITLVALMTLVQTGLEAFGKTSGDIAKPAGLLKKSPKEVLSARNSEKNAGGMFGFLKSVDKEYQITWDETDSSAKFDAIRDEELASAAARDRTRNWKNGDKRCIEGVIPVECRAAACGTCWVGVLSGADKLSDVAHLERKQMKVFGYKQGKEAKPILRLACQARAEGNVSIVIPPWNGVFGKKIYGVEEVILEPATTSAKKQREIIAEATNLTE
ncbi:MAG: 2Fe-2S iron-sulfur cluster-binding protein [Pyrinomonadaceae bacterium]